MNLLSIWSLQHSNPNVHITVLCDRQTIKALKKCHHQILKYVDIVIPVDTPCGPGGFRNRFIKTSMRRYIDGAFVYLDADTLIRGDISPVFDTDTSFSAAPNHSGNGYASEIPDTERIIFNNMSWTVPKKYVNGGVLFFSDKPDVHAFAELWHKKWLDCSARTSNHYDQQSLNSALNDSCIDFAWMNNRYNAQVNARPNTAWGAVVWHIYLSDHHASPKTILDFVLANLNQKQLDSSDLISALSKRDHPWIVENVIDRLALKRIRYNDKILRPKSWVRLWLADDYRGAIKSVFRAVRRRTIRLLSSSEKRI